MDQHLKFQPSSSSPPEGGGSGEAANRQNGNPETLTNISAAQNNNTRFGRHRLVAAIARLQNEINIIQEELEQLESIGGSSTVCNELVSSVDSRPDPLLPETIGPIDVNWDQWFRGAHGSRNHRRWI